MNEYNKTFKNKFGGDAKELIIYVSETKLKDYIEKVKKESYNKGYDEGYDEGMEDTYISH